VQTGIRPEYPFELPCGCELSEPDILRFLQRSCFCCGKRVQGLSYRLANSLRVMDKCLKRDKYLLYS